MAACWWTRRPRWSCRFEPRSSWPGLSRPSTWSHMEIIGITGANVATWMPGTSPGMTGVGMSENKEQLSIVRGIPLSEEPGLGPLTLSGFLKEVTSRFAEREALVLHGPEGVI